MNRKVIVVIIALIVGLLHFVTGPSYEGPFPNFVNGYMIDILLPFAMFLVFTIARQNIIKSNITKGIIIFLIGVVSETLQYFGLPIFGTTFDPLDYLMFLIGIITAYFFNKYYLTKFPRQSKDR